MGFILRESERETHQDNEFLLSNLNLVKQLLLRLTLQDAATVFTSGEFYFLRGKENEHQILTSSRQFTIRKQLYCDHIKIAIVLPHRQNNQILPSFL